MRNKGSLSKRFLLILILTLLQLSTSVILANSFSIAARADDIPADSEFISPNITNISVNKLTVSPGEIFRIRFQYNFEKPAEIPARIWGGAHNRINPAILESITSNSAKFYVDYSFDKNRTPVGISYQIKIIYQDDRDYQMYGIGPRIMVTNSIPNKIENSFVYECINSKPQFTFLECPKGIKSKVAGVYLGSRTWENPIDGKSAEYGLFYIGISKIKKDYLLNFIVKKISGDFEIGSTDSGFRLGLVGRDAYNESVVLGKDPIEKSFGGNYNQENNVKSQSQIFPLIAFLPDSYPMNNGTIQYEELQKGIYIIVRYKPVNRVNGSGSEMSTGFVYFLEGDKFPSQLIDSGIKSQKMDSFLKRAVTDTKSLKKLIKIVDVLNSINQVNSSNNCNFMVGGKCLDSNPKPVAPRPGGGCNFMVGGICRG